jgi:hypothetical protein
MPPIGYNTPMATPAGRARLAAAAALAVALGGGCRGRAKPAEPPGGSPTRPRTVAELYADYGRLRGEELLDKYKDGVVVAGPVERALDLGDEDGFQVWLAVGDPGDAAHATLRFKDRGGQARSRALKQGDAITASCRVGGKPGAVLFLDDCELK